MALPDKIKEKIAIQVIRTIVTRFDNFPEDASNNRNAPFGNDRKLTLYYNKTIFDSNGNYNVERYAELIKHITTCSN